VRVPDEVDVRGIRERMHLTQAAFALRFGFTAAAVRDWEQHRRKPQKAARILLCIIEQHPKAVLDALDS
jgi:putative transcriptional regulator